MNEERFLNTLQKLMAIDSVTGDYHAIQDYLVKWFEERGVKTQTLRKGGVFAEVGGEGHPLVLTAHADTIGLMVRHIEKDGSIKVVAVGGLYAYHCDQENVRIRTSEGKIYTGTIRRREPSVHVTTDEKWDEVADFAKNVIVTLDEEVKSAEDVRALGIEIGDYVSLDPRFTFENGYIKSRFIDDKVLLAIMMEAVEAMKEQGIKPSRKVTYLVAMYEEIGHGGSVVPADCEDFVAMDIACIGPEQTSSEKKVSIFCKDSRYPYHIDIVSELVAAAKAADAGYVKDILTPHYGTDADPALNAGNDIRHGAFGPGVVASHGYERTHMDGVKNTYELLMKYITL